MKIKTLISTLGLAVACGVALASESNAVLVSADGRILKAQGVPTELHLQQFATEPQMFDPRVVPASCKAFDMAKLEQSDDSAAGLLPGVPNVRGLVGAWQSAWHTVGAKPDAMFFCTTATGEKVFSQGQAINRAYEYRKADGAQTERGQVVSYVDGDMLIGVVFWNADKQPASQYLSMNFGR
jgi:hypothetical protein